MSAKIIELRVVRNYLAARERYSPERMPPELMPYKGVRRRLAETIADDDPAYELFNRYKQAEAAYRKAMNEHARHTGLSVMQVAKFMQFRRGGKGKS